MTSVPEAARILLRTGMWFLDGHEILVALSQVSHSAPLDITEENGENEMRVARYTQGEAKRLEDFWLANMPKAGDSNGVNFLGTGKEAKETVANERRSAIVNRLREMGPSRASEVAEAIGKPRSATSADLTWLRDKGFVVHHKNHMLWSAKK